MLKDQQPVSLNKTTSAYFLIVTEFIFRATFCLDSFSKPTLLWICSHRIDVKQFHLTIQIAFKVLVWKFTCFRCVLNALL